MSVFSRTLPVGLLLFSLAVSGCGPAESTADGDASGHGHDDHGHDDHEHGSRPASLHAAVHELTESRETIRKAILEGDADAAHGPLHEVAELLQVLPEVAAETDLPEAEWEAVKVATDKLFACYREIDKAFHSADADKKAAYEAVAADLDAALESIRERLPMTGEDPEEHGHADHEHHDHHDHDHDDADHHHGDDDHGDHDHDEEHDEGEEQP